MHAAFVRGDAHPVCRSIVCSQYTLCIHVFDVIQKCQLLDVWTGLSVLRPGRHSNKLTTPRNRNANTLACTDEPPKQKYAFVDYGGAGAQVGEQGSAAAVCRAFC